MMIANVVDGRAAQGDRPRATLVVVPGAVLKQWESEFKKHMDPDHPLEILKWHPNIESKFVLEMHDVVLATYTQVANSYPKPSASKKKAKPSGDADSIASQSSEDDADDAAIGPLKGKLGLLHQVDWLRICYDECHVIKNYRSRAAQAARHLKAKFTWLMSGSIVLNGIEEF